MILNKTTKTARTILAVSLCVIPEIGFKNSQPSCIKGPVYMRDKKKRNELE